MIHPEGRSLLPSPPASINAVSYPNPTRTQLNPSAGFFRLTPRFPCPLYLDSPRGHGSNSKLHGRISNEPRETRGRELVSEKAALLQLEELPGAAAAAPQDRRPQSRLHQDRQDPNPLQVGSSRGGALRSPPRSAPGSILQLTWWGEGEDARAARCLSHLAPGRSLMGSGGAKAGPLHG